MHLQCVVHSAHYSALHCRVKLSGTIYNKFKRNGDHWWSKTGGVLQEEMGFVAELGMLRSIHHPHLVQYLGCGINSEKQADGTVPKRYLAIVRTSCSLATCYSVEIRPQYSSQSLYFKVFALQLFRTIEDAV